MTVWLVTGSDGGHEPDAVFSAWTSREAAVKEYSRLLQLEQHYFVFNILEIEMDTPAAITQHGLASLT